MSATKNLGFGVFLLVLLIQAVASDDLIDYASVYGEALTKSIQYYEGQRSGKLPPNQRVNWRGDSGLKDGSDNNVDLVGGYYDAGDNVKFGFTMAYTITMLAWNVVQFGGGKVSLNDAMEAIKWGTDYLIKAHPEPNVLYAQVGDAEKDHECWQRPEDMTTPRTSYKIDEQHPGSDLAAETAAAFAASAIAFSKTDPKYSSLLLTHSKQLFDFARNHRGLYSDSIAAAKNFYPSSDDQDELLWAASWLYRATNDRSYINYIESYNGTGSVRGMFSWDDKFVGVQLNIAQLVTDGTLSDEGKWADYKSAVEGFLCNCLQAGNNNVKRSPGGLNWWDSKNNLQYVTSAAFVAAVYSEFLTEPYDAILCHSDPIVRHELIAFAQLQANYILGWNPQKMSYMVSFGRSKYPMKIHHRGASIISIKKDPAAVTCKGGYDSWYSKDAPDPNVFEGAVVGGPDQADGYTDLRSNFNQTEPTLVTTAPFVGVLTKLLSLQP